MHPEIDRYAQLDSPVHRWDPRWKIVAFTCLIVSFGLTSERARTVPSWSVDLPQALASLALSVLLVKISRIPLVSALRSIRPALFFLTILLIVLPLTHGDADASTKISLGPLTVSSQGFLIAVLIALRAFSILLLVFPMFGTAPFDHSLRALRDLRIPGRLVQLLGFTYRYIFVFANELRRLRLSWRARGFEPRFDLKTMRTVGNGIGMLILGSSERSERIMQAMLSRGYSSEIRVLSRFRTRPLDVLKSAFVVALAAIFVIWRLDIRGGA